MILLLIFGYYTKIYMHYLGNVLLLFRFNDNSLLGYSEGNIDS
jgi:hypothetical protein